MKCKHCGWMNDDEAMYCAKCKNELRHTPRVDYGQSQMPGQDRTIIDQNNYGAYYGADNVTTPAYNDQPQSVSEPKTMPYQQAAQHPFGQAQPVSQQSFGQAQSVSQQPFGKPQAEERRCPECDTLIPPGGIVCPRCGKEVEVKVSVNLEETVYCERCGSKLSADARFCSFCGSPVSSNAETQVNGIDTPAQPDLTSILFDDGLCNPYDGNPVNPFAPDVALSEDTVLGGPLAPKEPVPVCTLKPIAWENEIVEPRGCTCSGKEVELDRACLDPGNNTISRELQAKLTYEDGHWYIQDESELHTSYLRLNRKIELADGDIIVLGNREFEFKA